MKFINIIIGSIITSIGAGIGYINYFIISIFYNVSLWITNLLNAPQALAFLITIILMLWFIIWIIIIAIVALYVFIFGIHYMFS